MGKNNVIIVGAGAAGCMAAVTAAKNGANVTLIDKNQKIGRKLLITGKGRCNVTNNCDVQTLISSVTTNGRFLYSAFSSFSSEDTINFFQSNGVKLKTERGNRVYPESDKSIDIIDVFFRLIRLYKIKLINDSVSELIIKNGEIAGVRSEFNEYSGDKVIICCGGCSYPQTGSDGYGYVLARQAGHSIVEPRPSLVPIVTKEEWCARLQGLSLRNVSLYLKNNSGKQIYTDFGEMIFTHYGISGPIVLSASAHINLSKCRDYEIKIDLKPALTEEQLDKRIQKDFEKYINKDIINSLNELLPKKIIPVIVELSGIDFHTKCHEITKKQRKDLINSIKNLTVNFDCFRPISEAIVTSGGVSVKEINPKTMESKLINNLFFAGEVIDVDAYTGGFNLQIAFSTGYLAGISV